VLIGELDQVICGLKVIRSPILALLLVLASGKHSWGFSRAVIRSGMGA
jgi:hypothetical protein